MEIIYLNYILGILYQIPWILSVQSGYSEARYITCKCFYNYCQQGSANSMLSWLTKMLNIQQIHLQII